MIVLEHDNLEEHLKSVGKITHIGIDLAKEGTKDMHLERTIFSGRMSLIDWFEKYQGVSEFHLDYINKLTKKTKTGI